MKSITSILLAILVTFFSACKKDDLASKKKELKERSRSFRRSVQE
jgi:hypothetical protein